MVSTLFNVFMFLLPLSHASTNTKHILLCVNILLPAINTDIVNYKTIIKRYANTMKCNLCDITSAKYKCPRCRIPYCSLRCWEVHGRQKCQKPEEIIEESYPENYSFKTADTVPIDKLKLLSESEAVLSTLRNPHVRSILEAVDKSKNPSASLKLAMLEPIFVEFVDECLKIIEPAKTEETF